MDTVSGGEHGQRTTEGFQLGVTEHVVEAALKIVRQTNSWWGRIPDRGYSLSKSLEV